MLCALALLACAALGVRLPNVPCLGKADLLSLASTNARTT